MEREKAAEQEDSSDPPQSVASVFLRKGGTGAVVQALGIGSRAAAQFLLAAWLTAEGYGIYTFILSIVVALGVFSRLGLDTVILRFVSAHSADQEWGKLRGTISASFQVVGVSTLFFFVCSEGVVYALREEISHNLYRSLQVGLLLLPVSLVLRLQQYALQGLKKIWASRFPGQVLVPWILVAGGYGLVQTGNIDAINIIWLRNIAYVLAVAIGTYWLYRYIPAPVHEATAEYDFGQILSVGIPLLFASTMHLVLNRTDILMLGALRPMEDAGIYNASLQIAKLATFGLMATGLIASPLMSEAYETGDHNRLQQVVSFSAWASGMISLIFVVGVFLFGGFVLGVLGPEFVHGKSALWILLIGQVTNSWMGPVGQLLTMTGNEKEFSKIIAFAALLNVGLNGVLIPFFGIEGAATATMITTITWNLGVVWVAWTELRIRPALVSLP